MSEANGTPDWGTLDELIFANRKLELLQILRERHSCTLAEAIQVFTERYNVLRKGEPDRFIVSHGDYWAGFYS